MHPLAVSVSESLRSELDVLRIGRTKDLRDGLRGEKKWEVSALCVRKKEASETTYVNGSVTSGTIGKDDTNGLGRRRTTMFVLVLAEIDILACVIILGRRTERTMRKDNNRTTNGTLSESAVRDNEDFESRVGVFLCEKSRELVVRYVGVEVGRVRVVRRRSIASGGTRGRSILERVTIVMTTFERRRSLSLAMQVFVGTRRRRRSRLDDPLEGHFDVRLLLGNVGRGSIDRSVVGDKVGEEGDSGNDVVAEDVLEDVAGEGERRVDQGDDLGAVERTRVSTRSTKETNTSFLTRACRTPSW